MLAHSSARRSVRQLALRNHSLQHGQVPSAGWRHCKAAAAASIQQRILCRSAWDDNVSLAELQMQLDEAIDAEEYEKAARIRDTLQQRQTDSKLAVEDANMRFYKAFMSGSLAEMSAIWGKGDHVQVVHPGASCISSRELVMESWASILRGVRPGAFKIAVEDVRIWASDSAGFVTCVEVMDADDSQGRTVATNIFEKQNGKWVITHHHGSPVVRFR